jgi:hypothetical protein
MVTGLACVDEVLEAERAALCGARYAHQAERQALRAGHVPSSLMLGGRRVAVSRSRVRSVAGRELKLPRTPPRIRDRHDVNTIILSKPKRTAHSCFPLNPALESPVDKNR